MFTVEVRVQECASVTVTVYVPAARLEADAAVPPEGDHTYVYGGVPPLTEIAAAPSLPPRQETLEDPAVDIEIGVGVVTEVVAVIVQPFASVAVTV